VLASVQREGLCKEKKENQLKAKIIYDNTERKVGGMSREISYFYR
jgi:hypothetical protein